MNKNSSHLSQWQWEEYLTLHEATCLILDSNPNEISPFDFEAVKELPMYSLVFDRLNSDLSTLTYQEYIPPIPRIRDFDKTDDIDLHGYLKKLENIFAGNTIPEIKKLPYPEYKFPEGYKGYCDTPCDGEARTFVPIDLPDNHWFSIMQLNSGKFSPLDYQIKQSAIKQWLELKGIESDYFSKNIERTNKKEDPTQPTIDNLFVNPPKRQTTQYEKICSVAEKYIKSHQKLPSKKELWEYLLSEESGLTIKDKKITDISGRPMCKENFTKNFNRWTGKTKTRQKTDK